MTIAEFKAWFDGYTQGGGKDVEAVKAKLAEVCEPLTITYPTVPIPTWPTTPTYPWNPTPWIVWTEPSTTSGTTFSDNMLYCKTHA